MGEITEENKFVEITVKTIGPARPFRLSVSSPIKVRDLRKLIASSSSNHLPIENLRLIFRGKVLDDNQDDDDHDVFIQLSHGDSVIAAVKPKPPAKHLRDDTYIDDDDLDLKFKLPQSTSRWKKRLFFFLRNKLKLPDILLMAIFSLSLKTWTIIILWFIFAPIAYRWDLGPLYEKIKIYCTAQRLFENKILGTAFAIIFLNLGQRQPGDMSAYSIFNDDFRELPGTLNADRLDRDIRVGQI